MPPFLLALLALSGCELISGETSLQAVGDASVDSGHPVTGDATTDVAPGDDAGADQEAASDVARGDDGADALPGSSSGGSSGSSTGGSSGSGSGSDSGPDTGPDAGCVSASVRCNGLVPQTCAGGAWVGDVACSGNTPACLNGACVACSPSAVQCSGQRPQSCTASGTA